MTWQKNYYLILDFITVEFPTFCLSSESSGWIQTPYSPQLEYDKIFDKVFILYYSILLF